MNIDKFDLCTGCKLCSNICPKNSIEFNQDKLGFAIPYVNDTCIDCSKCVRNCVAQKKVQLNNNLDIYACKNKDSKIENLSSSGGIFFELAKYIINKNGVVYGCVLKNMQAIHKRVDSIENLYEILGSKYIESDLSNVYANIKNDLQKGLVLFAGMPCQVDAIKSFANCENLITVDLVCHGVPSKILFDKYINEIENKYNSKIIKYSFRKKSDLYGNQNVFIKLDNKKEIFIPHSIDPFYALFFSDKFLKKSCYDCKYCSTNRTGDITIGDFWNHQKYCKELKSENNLSIVLINTINGQKIFNEISIKNFRFEKIYEDVSKSQSPLREPLGKRKLDSRVDDDDIRLLTLSEILKKYIFNNSKEYFKYRFKIILFKIRVLDLIKKLNAH